MKMIRMKSSDMGEEGLCPKCKSDYLKPTDDPRKMIVISGVQVSCI